MLINKHIQQNQMPEIQTDTNSDYSEQQLKSLIHKNQSRISNLNQSVAHKRKQLLKVSDNMTKLIQKKVLYKKQNTAYKHPNFKPQFDDQQLNIKNTIKQGIYREIEDLKQKIFVWKDTRENQLFFESQKKKNQIKQLTKQLQKNRQQKTILQTAMQQNKQILTYYKNSQCLQQIEQSKAELEAIKKQTKLLDRQYNQFVAEEVMQNLYLYGMKAERQKIQHPEQLGPLDQAVNPQKINELIAKINKIIQQRNACQKKEQIQCGNLNKNIMNLVHENAAIQKKIRSLESSRMKKQLEIRHIQHQQERKNQIMKIEENKMKKHRGNYFKEPKDNNHNRQSAIFQLSQYNSGKLEKLLFESDDKNEEIDNINENQQEINPDQNTKEILIGKWNPQNCINDYNSLPTNQQSPNKKKIPISKALSITLKNTGQNKQKITFIYVTYVDKQGVEHRSRGIGNLQQKDHRQQKRNIQQQNLKIHKNQIDENIVIDFEDVEDFRYMPIESQKLGVKWMMKDGRVIEIGTFSEQSSKDLISMNKYSIGFLDFCLDETCQQIVGMKIVLKPYIKQSLGLGFAQNKSPLKKWRSNSEVSMLTKKKVFVKPSSHAKKFSDQTQVDHRLLLNRRKKMV